MKSPRNSPRRYFLAVSCTSLTGTVWPSGMYALKNLRHEEMKKKVSKTSIKVNLSSPYLIVKKAAIYA